MNKTIKPEEMVAYDFSNLDVQQNGKDNCYTCDNCDKCDGNPDGNMCNNCNNCDTCEKPDTD